MGLMWAPARYVVLENPVSAAATRIRGPSQVIQPWMFGHREVKTTCLWLFGGVPALKATHDVGPPPASRVERKPGSVCIGWLRARAVEGAVQDICGRGAGDGGAVVVPM